jgi:O-methyltransferase
MKLLGFEIRRVRRFPPERSYHPPETHYQGDAVFHPLYREALSATGTPESELRRERFYTLYHIARSVLSNPALPGNVIEFGVWRGLSAFILSRLLAGIGSDRSLSLVDSFQGLSSFEKEDQKGSSIQLEERDQRSFFAYPLKEVKKNLEHAGITPRYYPGWIPEVLGSIEEQRYALAHIDLDLYQPTRAALEYVWPRLSHGGVVIDDDYGVGYFPGARLAVEEFIGAHRDAVLIPTPAGNGALVKVSR